MARRGGATVGLLLGLVGAACDPPAAATGSGAASEADSERTAQPAAPVVQAPPPRPVRAVVPLTPEELAGGSLRMGDMGFAMRYAVSSTHPVADGARDCAVLAEGAATVGEVVDKLQKAANLHRAVSCASSEAGPWKCKADFVYSDAAASERDWSVMLRFDVDDAGSLSELTCFVGG